jgi:hypothetical protein
MAHQTQRENNRYCQPNNECFTCDSHGVGVNAQMHCNVRCEVSIDHPTDRETMAKPCGDVKASSTHDIQPYHTTLMVGRPHRFIQAFCSAIHFRAFLRAPCSPPWALKEKTLLLPGPVLPDTATTCWRDHSTLQMPSVDLGAAAGRFRTTGGERPSASSCLPLFARLAASFAASFASYPHKPSHRQHPSRASPSCPTRARPFLPHRQQQRCYQPSNG